MLKIQDQSGEMDLGHSKEYEIHHLFPHRVGLIRALKSRLSGIVPVSLAAFSAMTGDVFCANYFISWMRAISQDFSCLL